MSATGKTWHQEGGEARGGTVHTTVPFLKAAVELTGENSAPTLVRWWINVLRLGAEYPPHKHDGKWSFVYHLTEGAAVHFSEVSFRASPGQILVFDSNLPHWTDKAEGVRVSIAGNLYFKR